MEAFNSLLASFIIAVLAFFHLAAPASAPAAVVASAEQPVARPVTILFGGDMMFDRTIRTAIEKRGQGAVLDCLDKTLDSADLVVANLEGPITGNLSKSVGSQVGAPDNFVFTFPTSTAPMLKVHHIGLVNLGNNHILNFGRAGVESTESALAQAGVGFFGDPVDTRIHTEGLGGQQFAFINYNEYGPAGAAADASTTIAQIKAAKAADLIPIVYTHWGIEYATSAPAYVQKRGHEFVDAGAVLVIGSSPHVVEQEETYLPAGSQGQGVPIFYSLGNMVFDQYWNDSVDHGLMVAVTFASSTLQSVQKIPIVMNRDGSTCREPT